MGREDLLEPFNHQNVVCDPAAWASGSPDLLNQTAFTQDVQVSPVHAAVSETHGSSPLCGEVKRVLLLVKFQGPQWEIYVSAGNKIQYIRSVSCSFAHTLSSTIPSRAWETAERGLKASPGVIPKVTQAAGIV